MADEKTLTDYEQAAQEWARLDAEESGPDTPPDPAPEPAPSPEEPDPPKEDQKEAPAATPVPTSSLSAEERELLKQIPSLVQGLRNTAGNVGELKNQLTRLGNQAAQATQGAAPTEKQIAKAAETPEAWKRMQDDFPDWAAAIEAYHQANRQEVPDFNAVIQERLTAATSDFERKLQEREQRMAERTVEALKPGALATLRSADLGNWLLTQPAEYRSKALESWEPAEVLGILGDFEKSRTAKPADPPPKQQRLASAVMPSSSSAPIKKSESEMSPEELWALEDEADRRSAAQRAAY